MGAIDQIENVELKLLGSIYGNAPVQAEGTINAHSFYFRSRWTEWSFAVSEHSEIDPVDIQNIETGNQYGYFACGQYGEETDYDASYMEPNFAKDIIQKCSIDYLRAKGVLKNI